MKKHLYIILILILASVLRLYALDKYPAGLNSDEAAIGYNAWSLIETGKDEHSASWPLVFRSFDDYKPPVYFYLVLPFVKMFGLNIWSVRLPSALLGITSIYLLYLIVQRFLVIPAKSGIHQITQHSTNLALISALVLATSPWHLQFSRGGWEVNAALFFILLGIYGFFRGLENPKFLYLFVVSFATSLYTYHSARLISPLLALALVVIYWKQLFVIKTKLLIFATVLGLLLSLPLAFQMLSKEGQSRFTGVSVFSDSGPLWQALEARREHPAGLYVRLIHNQYLTYGLRFTKNYLSHFSPRFLYINGDEIARSRVPDMGQGLLFLFPLFLVGLLNLLKLDFKWKKIVLFWFLISPLAAALTFQSPHALRAQNMVIPLSIITALGIVGFFEFIKKNKLLYKILIFSIFGFLSFYSVAQYLHQYYVHYPKELPFAWQYGFEDIASYVQKHYSEYDKFIITDRYDQPYILMAFFLQYPPAKLQSQMKMTPRDKFGFSTLNSFDKFVFKTINYDLDKNSPNTLIIASMDEGVDDKKVIDIILDPAGLPMYKIISTSTVIARSTNDAVIYTNQNR